MTSKSVARMHHVLSESYLKGFNRAQVKFTSVLNAISTTP
jgi:hypothetical protein